MGEQLSSANFNGVYLPEGQDVVIHIILNCSSVFSAGRWLQQYNAGSPPGVQLTQEFIYQSSGTQF